MFFDISLTMTDYVVFGGKILTISDCVFKFKDWDIYYYLKALNKIQKYYVFKTAITSLYSI